MFVLERSTVLAAMRRRGFRTVSALADHLGVHRNSLGRYLAGEPVLPDSVSKLLQLLALDVGQAVKIAEDPRFEGEEISTLIDELLVRQPRAAYVLFGSRARGRAQRYSDFDVGVFSKGGISTETYLRLLETKEDFEEQSPFFVDLVNLSRASQDFLRGISKDLIFLAGRQTDWLELKRISALEGAPK